MSGNQKKPLPDMSPKLGLKEYWKKREDIGSFREGIIVNHSHNLVTVCIQVNGDKQGPGCTLFGFHSQEDLPKSHMSNVRTKINGMVQVHDTVYNCDGAGSSKLLLDNQASADLSKPFGV